MRTFILIVAMLLNSVIANSADLGIRYGFGAGHKIVPEANERSINVRYIRPLWRSIHMSLDGGLLIDNGLDLKTGYGFISIGPRVHPFEWVYIENLFGPGLITQTDPMLGSIFQFGIDIGVGVKEPSTGAALGLSFKHISNAGLVSPNLGRNMWLISASVGL